MTDNTCGKCEYYKGANAVCGAEEQHKRVGYYYPICWSFVKKEDNADQSDWMKQQRKDRINFIMALAKTNI